MIFSSKFFYGGKGFLPTRETFCACQCFQIFFLNPSVNYKNAMFSNPFSYENVF